MLLYLGFHLGHTGLYKCPISFLFFFLNTFTDDYLSDGVDEEDVVEITDDDESDAVEVINNDDGSGEVDTKAGEEHDDSEESADDGDSGKVVEEGDEDAASHDDEDESQMDANDDVQLGGADNQR